MHCIIKTHRQKAWDDMVAPTYQINNMKRMERLTHRGVPL